MKTAIKLMSMLLAAIAMTACGSSDDPAEGMPNYHRNAKYTMRLRLAGDYIEESDMPLTKTMDNAPANTYIGVNVLYKKNAGDASYSMYAYGLFDDPEKMRVDLTSGNQYQIKVTAIKNHTDLLQLESNAFSTPFRYGTNANNDNNPQYKLENVNKFIYSSEVNFPSLGKGTARVKSELDDYEGKSARDYKFPRVHRYYGSKDFTFTPNMGDIEIDLTYKSFGLKITTGALPEGFTLSWQDDAYSSTKREETPYFDSAASFVYDEGKNASGYEWEEIYSLNSLSNNDVTRTLKFTLKSTSGPAKTIEKEVTFKAGFKKVLNVVVNGNTESSGSKISISSLDETLTPEESEDVDITL